MKLYFDVCCLNRPFDDQTQDRILLESEAVKAILKHIRKGDWQWISSEVVDYEIQQTPDNERRYRVSTIARFSNEKILINEPIIIRADEIANMGLDAFDALHLACAEYAKVDVFLTTDDKLLRRIRKIERVEVRVENPLSWLREVIQ
jgi:predicted nucleic acid-binding protein